MTPVALGFRDEAAWAARLRATLSSLDALLALNRGYAESVVAEAEELLRAGGLTQAAEETFLAWKLAARHLLLKHLRRLVARLGDVREAVKRLEDMGLRGVVSLAPSGEIDVVVTTSNVVRVARLLAEHGEGRVAEEARRLLELRSDAFRLHTLFYEGVAERAGFLDEAEARETAERLLRLVRRVLGV